MPLEHVVLKEQAAWDTYVTPDTGIYFDEFSVNPGLEWVERRTTGRNRGLSNQWQGIKMIEGSFSLPAWETKLGMLLKAAYFTDVASTQQGATDAYKHGFIQDDSTPPNGLSAQIQHGTSEAQHLIGMIISSLTFQCAAGEPLVISGDFIAMDEAPLNGNWDYDGSAAPASLVTPVNYPADSIVALMFDGAQLFYGGALTWNDGENIYTISGETEVLTIEQASLTVENNPDPRAFWGRRTARNVVGQDRVISGSLDFDQSTPDHTFYDLMRAGTQSVLKMLWTGNLADTGYDFQFEIIVPNLVFRTAQLPTVQGANDRRMQSVEFTGEYDTNDNDIAISIVDTEDSY